MKRSPCHLFFETLATELKIDIIEELRRGPKPVGELSKSLGQERSKVSHALLSLSECGFVEAERKGKTRVYSLNKRTIAPLLSLVEKHVKQHCKSCGKMKR